MTQIKLKPSLRFIGFNLQWGRKKLVDLADIFDGTHQTPKYVKSGIPFVSVENINDLEGTTKFITEAAFKKDFKNKPQIDDILMTRITAGIIGATAIIRSNKPLGYYVSLAMIRRKTSIDVTFLNHAISTDFFKRELHKRIIHVAFPKKINLGDINDCVVSFPEEESEQQKISGFLTAVDRRIELLQQKKEKLGRYKKGVMQQLFTRKIRFKADDGSEFPDWEEKKLGEVANIKMGQSPESKSYNMTGIGLPLIQGNADIFERKTSPRQWTSQPTKTCQIGDLILTVRAPVGFIAKSDHNACIGRGVCSIGNNPNFSDLQFIFQFLLFFETRWKNIEQGSTFTAVSGSDISSVKIPTPSLLEQFKIGEFLNSFDELVDGTKTQIQKLQTWKKGLLQQMFV